MYESVSGGDSLFILELPLHKDAALYGTLQLEAPSVWAMSRL